MFAIVIPGKAGAVIVRYASAMDALTKYREMEADGFTNIDVKDAKGENVSASELEARAREADDGRAEKRLPM